MSHYYDLNEFEMTKYSFVSQTGTLVSLLECFLVTKPEYIFSTISFLMLMCHVANNSSRMMSQFRDCSSFMSLETVILNVLQVTIQEMATNDCVLLCLNRGKQDTARSSRVLIS